MAVMAFKELKTATTSIIGAIKSGAIAKGMLAAAAWLSKEAIEGETEAL